jgi:hypothetical protein
MIHQQSPQVAPVSVQKKTWLTKHPLEPRAFSAFLAEKKEYPDWFRPKVGYRCWSVPGARPVLRAQDGWVADKGEPHARLWEIEKEKTKEDGVRREEKTDRNCRRRTMSPVVSTHLRGRNVRFVPPRECLCKWWWSGCEGRRAGSYTESRNTESFGSLM